MSDFEDHGSVEFYAGPNVDESALGMTGEIPYQATGSLSDAEFAELYALHQPRLVEYFKRKGDPFMAEDVVQGAFARAYSSLDKFTPGSSFGGWIFTIARNHHLNTSVRSISRNVPTDPLDFSETPSGAEDPSEVVSDLMGNPRVRRTVADALEELSPGMRDVFCTVVLEERQSPAEYAESNGISVLTVGTRIHRARQKLKAAIDPGELSSFGNDEA